MDDSSGITRRDSSMMLRPSLISGFDDDPDANNKVDNADAQEVSKATRWTWLIAFLVVLGGAATSAVFIHYGTRSVRAAQEQRFDRHATDLYNKFKSTFREYETAAAWIHEACRNWRDGDFTREDFHVLYKYIVNSSDETLDFFLAEWVPNITHAERADLEAESAAFYANDTNVNYNGIWSPQQTPIQNESVYFPIQYIEPYERIGNAVHLDLYSLSHERKAIDMAIETFEPVLTERFEVESQVINGFSVSLIHPGVRLPDDIYTEPQDLAILLIHIRSLLERVAGSKSVSKAVYIYDCKPKDCTLEKDYLGGAEIGKNGKIVTFYDSEKSVDFERIQTANMRFSMSMKAGQRDWMIEVVSVDDSYKPNNLTALVGGVVICLASLLMAWVWIIHNRRRSKHAIQILKKAAAESAIVASLFPNAVRDRLIEQNKLENKPQGMMGANKLIPHADYADDDDGMPIADEYQNTTIMFADMAGFTSWSSNREPQTVFKLLETLYGAFDVIAKQMRVFKVETIGDCYLAVTGIPNAQPKHAKIMTIFAWQCMKKMREIVHDLAGDLGEDTLDLQMRVGLHSGPVTAGVLRGEKARFQLFGDTVNTASRMESNGAKGRIHCSQATADALTVGGKGRWLTPREEKIVAKGKGEMQTYWIIASENRTSTTSTNSEERLDFTHDKASPDDIQDLKTAIIEARQRKRSLEGTTETSTELRKDAKILKSENVEDLVQELQMRRSSAFKKKGYVMTSRSSKFQRHSTT